ncbi:hypothetical protein [Streptomyces anthocyanicus]|uniref:hypothetical protein n=1 Tax=Streptomyces anthocyanicus TaxID=68174 RepID=UPI00167005E0|nr:hypothetical protein [Streptomyces anthocyanicus]
MLSSRSSFSTASAYASIRGFSSPHQTAATFVMRRCGRAVQWLPGRVDSRQGVRLDGGPQPCPVQQQLGCQFGRSVSIA